MSVSLPLRQVNSGCLTVFLFISPSLSLSYWLTIQFEIESDT